MDKQERERLFNEAYAAHRGLVAATVRKTAWNADASEVEDIVQDVMIVAWREFDPDRSATFAPWLITTARRTTISHMRKSINRASLMERHLRELGDGTEAVSAHGRTAALTEALAGLKPSIREIVMLHAEGKSARGIARVVGIHRDTVGKRLEQGLKRLRRLLVTAA